MNQGRLHSIETFGAVDGPGIRTVFFLQGCPARCAYCHNPDTWNPCGGTAVGIDEIVSRAKRGMPYYGEDGGVTFSGGEPLLQGKFLYEAIKGLKAEGIGCAIDTSGTYYDQASEAAIAEADLLLLDIKHTEPALFKELTGCGQESLFKVIETINRLEKPIWVRQVIVPGFNDTQTYIKALNSFLSRIKTVRKVELLGYHNMAESKYQRLGLEYKLKGLEAMDQEKLRKLNAMVKR